jgi:hypothetical protein
MNAFTRRNFIGTAAAAVGSLAVLQKVAGADRSRSDPGPANAGLDGQDPDSIWPPATDSKSLVQNFKYHSPLQINALTKADGHAR